MHVHLDMKLSKEQLQILKAELGPVFTVGTDADGLRANTEILVSGRPVLEQLDACPQLRRLIIPWSGLPTPTRKLMLARPEIQVHNLHHNAGVVAEMALGLLLAAARRILPCDRALRDNRWLRGAQSMEQLSLRGRKALVLGGGAIGSRVADLCAAFGMQVKIIRRRPGRNQMGQVHEEGGQEQLHDWLRETEALIICLPLTRKTHALIGQRELAAMPRGGLLVNVSRGPILDSQALYLALKSGYLFGAGIDAWYEYPGAGTDCHPPASEDFSGMENLVMSPHRAGAPGESGLEKLRLLELREILVADMLRKGVPNRVDIAEGY